MADVDDRTGVAHFREQAFELLRAGDIRARRQPYQIVSVRLADVAAVQGPGREDARDLAAHRLQRRQHARHFALAGRIPGPGRDCAARRDDRDILDEAGISMRRLLGQGDQRQATGDQRIAVRAMLLARQIDVRRAFAGGRDAGGEVGAGRPDDRLREAHSLFASASVSTNPRRQALHGDTYWYGLSRAEPSTTIAVPASYSSMTGPFFAGAARTAVSLVSVQSPPGTTSTG